MLFRFQTAREYLQIITCSFHIDPGIIHRSTTEDNHNMQGQIQDFKLGGGGGALKKNAPSGGRHEKFWSISCVKKIDFTPKNHILSNCGGWREKFWGISCEKSRFYAKKSIFFPILWGVGGGAWGGGACRVRPPPPPLICCDYVAVTYWSGSSSRHFLRFLSNIFKKQSRNLCFTPLLFCMNHNDLPTK